MQLGVQYTIQPHPKGMGGLQVPRITQQFWGTQDELSIEARLLIKGSHICAPLKPLNHTLADLHGAHQGMEKMWPQTRGAIYWPGIDAYIADHIHQCTICTKHKASPPAQLMLPRDIPDGPWQEIAADYFTHKGKEYLLICDLFSKYPFPVQSFIQVCLFPVPVGTHLPVQTTQPYLHW